MLYLWLQVDSLSHASSAKHTGGKIQISSIHILAALSYKDFQTVYHYRTTKNSKENDSLYTTREMPQLLI